MRVIKNKKYLYIILLFFVIIFCFIFTKVSEILFYHEIIRFLSRIHMVGEIENIPYHILLDKDLIGEECVFCGEVKTIENLDTFTSFQFSEYKTSLADEDCYEINNDKLEVNIFKVESLIKNKYELSRYHNIHIFPIDKK